MDSLRHFADYETAIKNNPNKMSERVLLFHLNNETITITIEAKFEGDSLVIEGYDIGKKVNDAWGDSDYEYSITVPIEEMGKLSELLNIKPFSKPNMLLVLSKRYNTNFCFSEIKKLLEDNNIKYKGFSWS